MITKAILRNGNIINLKFGRYLTVAPFFYKIFRMTENNNEEKRPSKMIGVAFPKAKYGVIAAIIIIIGVNLIYYKETIFSFLK